MPSIVYGNTTFGCLKADGVREQTGISRRSVSDQVLRRIELVYTPSLPTIDDAFLIDLGRWVADTPPAIARALSQREAHIAVGYSTMQDRAGSALAQTVRLYLKARLPERVECLLEPGGRSGQILVEIRRVG